MADTTSRMYPSGHEPESDATLYFFREGFNPSGNRFIFFVKDATLGIRARTEGYSAGLDGGDIRYLYKGPSRRPWIDDETATGDGWHSTPGGEEEVRGYFSSTPTTPASPRECSARP